MKIVNLIQGTPQWNAHRAVHFNASDAAAMLGVSPHKSRRALLDELHLGLTKEISSYVQEKVLDPGHEFEARARALAENIIGEDLYPCVGTEGRLSASFDGLTLLNDTAFEHKTLNDELLLIMADGLDGSQLPEFHRIQMEQQCLVSGAGRVLFMASRWDGETLIEERHCYYTPDPVLRQRIVDGWKQFEADLAAHTVEGPAAPLPTGRPPGMLPALRIELTGAVTASNLAEFRDTAIAVFQGIRTDLQTDQDFADAEQTVKWCEDIEDRLRAAKDHALSQTRSIDELFRAIDAITAESKAKRLELDKLVKARKEQIRGEIMTNGRDAVIEHYRVVNATLGEHAIAIPSSLPADLAAAVKGKRTVTTLKDAVDGVVTAAKISASQRADAVRANVVALAEASAGNESLFPDRVALCASKSPEDLRNLAAARIRDHQQREAAKRDEAERAAAVAALSAAAAIPALSPSPIQSASLGNDARAAAEPPPLAVSPTAAVLLQRAGAAPTPAGARIKLGDINVAIAPLSITADGLASLGFKSIGTDRAAKLYAASDFEAIRQKLIAQLSVASLARAA